MQNSVSPRQPPGCPLALRSHRRDLIAQVWRDVVVDRLEVLLGQRQTLIAAVWSPMRRLQEIGLNVLIAGDPGLDRVRC